MVSFSCEACNDVVIKRKLDQHRNQCRGAKFSCLDCSAVFSGTEYRAHTTCITEAQKYQGKLYKEPKKNINNKQSQNQPAAGTTPSQALVPKKPQMESTLLETDTRVAIVDVIPRAPSPPAAFNVFDFLIPHGEADSTHPLDSPESSPSSSDVSSSSEDESEDSDSMDTDEIDPVEDSAAAAREYMKQELLKQGFLYGNEEDSFDRFQNTQFPPSPAGQSGQFETPAPSRGHHRNISTTSVDSTTKESTKKRKRGQPEELDLSSARAYRTNGDIVMTDVPAPLHSGLTGGLNRLLSRPELPPSPPDLDGSPQTPVKRSKRVREEKKSKEKEKDKPKKEKDASKTKKEKKDKKTSASLAVKDVKNGQWVRIRNRKNSNNSGEPSSEHEQPARKQLKAIEYNPDGDDKLKATPQNAMVLHSKQAVSRAELFLSTAIKDTDDESRGCSLSKALKRYHKERAASAKKSVGEEKDLWKVLRVRKNARGEMVLFIEGQD